MHTTQSGFVESNGFYYPPYAREQVLKLLEYIQSGTALDIGAGFGNNVEPLVKSGFHVTATETNPECIEALQKLAAQSPGKIEVMNTPLEQLALDRQFDAVICTMVLHFLEPQDAMQAIKNMQAWTKPGGMNVITGYTINVPETHEAIKFLFKKNELKDFYKDWDIVLYDEVFSGTNNPSGKSWESAKLIVQKRVMENTA